MDVTIKVGVRKKLWSKTKFAPKLLGFFLIVSSQRPDGLGGYAIVLYKIYKIVDVPKIDSYITRERKVVCKF